MLLKTRLVRILLRRELCGKASFDVAVLRLQWEKSYGGGVHTSDEGCVAPANQQLGPL